MRRTLVIVFILTLATGSFAQSHRSRRHKEPPAPVVPSAKQSEEMKKMTDTFAGQWKTMATVEKGPLFPEAGTATGRSDFRSGPAGNSIVEHAHSHGAMGLFAGTGLIWWDAKAAAYKAIWCDSLAPEGCDPLGNGQWDGNDLVFTNVVDLGQNKLHIRNTYSNITADTFTYTLETGMDDAPLTKAITVQYERVQPRTTVVAPPQPTQPETAQPTAPENNPQKPQ